MWEKCPCCNSWAHKDSMFVCNVCLNTGIISSISGRPPISRETEKEEPQEKKQIGFIMDKKEEKVEEEIKENEV